MVKYPPPQCRVVDKIEPGLPGGCPVDKFMSPSEEGMHALTKLRLPKIICWLNASQQITNMAGSKSHNN